MIFPDTKNVATKNVLSESKNVCGKNVLSGTENVYGKKVLVNANKEGNIWAFYQGI